MKREGANDIFDGAEAERSGVSGERHATPKMNDIFQQQLRCRSHLKSSLLQARLRNSAQLELSCLEFQYEQEKGRYWGEDKVCKT